MKYKRYSSGDIREAQKAYCRDAGIEPSHLSMNLTSRFMSHLLMVTIDVMIELAGAIEDLADRSIDEDDGEAWRGGR